MVRSETNDGNSGNTYGFLFKLTSGGATDTSFGTNGFSEETLLGPNSLVYPAFRVPMTRQSDGKILAGFNNALELTQQTYLGRVFRYSDAGTLDPTFSSGGQLMLNYSGQTNTTCEMLAVLPDGGIALTMPFGVAKLKANGSYDPNFGINGVKIVSNTVYLFVQDDGKIIVSGLDWIGNRPVAKIQRLMPNGTNDIRFGTFQAKTQVTWNADTSSGDIYGGKMFPVDSRHIFLVNNFYEGTDAGRILLTKVIISK